MKNNFLVIIILELVDDASGRNPAPNAPFTTSQIIAAGGDEVEMGQLSYIWTFRGCVQRECKCNEDDQSGDVDD